MTGAPEQLETGPSGSGTWARAWLLAMLGAAAGLGSWLLIQQLSPRFGSIPPELFAKAPLAQYDPELMAEITAAGFRAHCRVVALSFGIVGAVVACSLRWGQALLARAPGRGAALGVAGLAVGGTAGAVGGLAAAFAGEWLNGVLPLQHGSYRTMLMHVAAWSITAVGIGIIIATASTRNRARLVLATIGTAVLAALLYVPLATLLFPMENSDLLMPAGTFSRAIFFLLPSTLMGLCAASALKETAATVRG